MANFEFNPTAKGIVFDIQRFSVHDGPGIRTLVFLKGCPLSCRWCSNPESQQEEPEIIFMPPKCIDCQKCQAVCSTGAIDFNLASRIWREKCNLCGRCTDVCNAEALSISGGEQTVAEVLAELKTDSIYYRRSGGGITLSGGEPLGQPGFAEELLKGCKAHGWHTAIETTGLTSERVLKRILPWVDLFLFDLKHMDTEKHREGVKVSNEIILQNARIIAQFGVPMIIRVPVIPQFNDNVGNIRATTEFALKLETVRELHLLPYHRLGQQKYAFLGREYPLEGLTPPSRNDMLRLKELVESYGLACSIGGH